MSFRKLSLTITLSAAFGLIACSSDSGTSSNGTSNNGTIKASCKVISEEPLVIEQSENGVTTTTTFKLVDNRVEQTLQFNINIPSGGCKDYEDDSDVDLISCSGKTIVTRDKEETSEAEFNTSKKVMKASCKESDGTLINVTNSDDDEEEEDNTPSNTKNNNVEPETNPPAKDNSESDDPVKPSNPATEDPETDDPATEDPAEPNNSATDGDDECTDGETQNLLGISMKCEGGQWVSDMEECNAENEGKTSKQSFLGLEVELVCHDGEWEEPPCNNGETKTQSFMGMDVNMKCVDGEWEADL